MMSNTYHYSLCIILLIFGDLKGFCEDKNNHKILSAHRDDLRQGPWRIPRRHSEQGRSNCSNNLITRYNVDK